MYRRYAINAVGLILILVAVVAMLIVKAVRFVIRLGS